MLQKELEILIRKKISEALLREDEALNSLVAQLNSIRNNEIIVAKPVLARKIEEILRELGTTPGEGQV